jgi:hypothetical protein
LALTGLFPRRTPATNGTGSGRRGTIRAAKSPGGFFPWLFLLAACATPPQPGLDAGPCALTVELGRAVSENDSTFLPFRDGELVDLVFGFQGFRFIQSMARLDSDAGEVTLEFDIGVEGHPRFQVPGGTFRPRKDGSNAYVDRLLVFFNDIPVPELVGRAVEIRTTVVSGRCTGRHKASVVFSNRVQCQSEDGGSPCADAGS